MHWIVCGKSSIRIQSTGNLELVCWLHSYKEENVLYSAYEGAGTCFKVNCLNYVRCAWFRFDQLKPQKHGVEFRRPTTLAGGNAACDFVLRKLRGGIAQHKNR